MVSAWIASRDYPFLAIGLYVTAAGLIWFGTNLYVTGRCFKSGLSLPVVSGRAAHLQTAGHGHNRNFDTGGRMVEKAKARVVLSLKDVPILHVPVEYQGSLFRFEGNGERFLCAKLSADWILGSCRARRDNYARMVYLGDWIDGFWRKVLYLKSREAQPRRCDPCWTPAGVEEIELNDGRSWLVSAGSITKGEKIYVHPWTFKVFERPFSNVSLALNGPQSEESYQHISSGDSDHDQFSDSRLWSYMVGALMFLLGCGFAHQAARLWIDCGRLRLSLCCVAVGFSPLYFGQAFVLFGFWWL